MPKWGGTLTIFMIVLLDGLCKIFMQYILANLWEVFMCFYENIHATLVHKCSSPTLVNVGGGIDPATEVTQFGLNQPIFPSVPALIVKYNAVLNLTPQTSEAGATRYCFVVRLSIDNSVGRRYNLS